MKTLARILGVVVMLVGINARHASADHSPHFDVRCPTGSAHIVLDPGHGGSDPGAIRTNPDLAERDLVLEISLMVAHLLEEETGLTVALTRSDNETELGNSERGEIANACGALLFIEIHLNAATDPAINRAQSFWGEKEKDLALSIVMNQSLASLGIPVSPVDRFDNGGLLRARMPSVLVEAVFLTNDAESNRLQHDNRQQAIASAIADGAIAWLGATDVIVDPETGSNR